MKNTKRTIRIAVAATLALALSLTGLYAPAVGQTASPSAAPVGVTVAYAAATGGAVTGGAVTAPAVISAAQVAPITDRAYTGKSQKPKPKVTLNGQTLKRNRDYTLKYSKNKLPGTATITIAAKGKNYTGTKQVTFKILVQKPTKFKLKATSDKVLGSWKKPSGKITGYKFVYASNASFTKEKKTKSVKSPKDTGYAIDRPFYKAKYYAKVRAYVTIKGKNYYSEYTNAKSKSVKAAGWFSKISNKIGSDTKWIDIDLSKQIVYLHKGKKTTVKRFACSTGKPGTPTPKGTYSIYKKIALHDMKGDWDPVKKKWGYIAKDVPWSTYFVSDIAFHGASWNPQVNLPLDQPRIPKSHGCINMRVSDAKYLYDWAPMGTIVSVHK
jgi:lipoprotein-anchoring transpeptidase ErfK/SrfK